uniref:Uncharacterized protein n=1 Tax=Amphora coffeiformis TaxID=265554 RepID=A0A7S3P591_9STRA|mmetsp:Transcript_8614/g.17348  ORF Transcript_8614/g.17348 Transcript_8614/m.17348 type:complete len:382 (+) Transcript_8614:54-1199(+)|eukprot:scaffold9208_cov154-Amphora_coffeaeformis.AAC.10
MSDYIGVDGMGDVVSSPQIALCVMAGLASTYFLRHHVSRKAKQSQSVMRLKGNKETIPKLLSSEKIDAIINRKWKQVLEFIVFDDPSELSLPDKKGHTVLHHMCLFRAPIEIIQMVLWQRPELASQANADGELPLHWAVRLSAPNECIRSLLVANRDTATSFWDKEGHSPLSLFWDRHKNRYLDIYWEGKENLLALRAWKRLIMFFQPQEKDDSAPSPLHAAADSICPPALFPLLIQVYRDQLRVADETGRNPLHIACSDPVSNRSTDLRTKIQNLLKEDADAAQQMDKQGRTAFMIALEAGIAWNEGLKELFELTPYSSSVPDPVTWLPPFLLAATGASHRMKKAQERKRAMMLRNCSEKSLETVFRLLNANPSCIEVIR